MSCQFFHARSYGRLYDAHGKDVLRGDHGFFHTIGSCWNAAHRRDGILMTLGLQPTEPMSAFVPRTAIPTVNRAVSRNGLERALWSFSHPGNLNAVKEGVYSPA